MSDYFFDARDAVLACLAQFQPNCPLGHAETVSQFVRVELLDPGRTEDRLAALRQFGESSASASMD